MAKVRALMSGAGTAPVLESLYATENGYYTPSQGVDGYDQVTVAVPEPVIITKNIVANGTYNAVSDDATGYSSVTVNVPEGIPGIIIDTDMPTSAIGNNGDYYYMRNKSGNIATNNWSDGGSGQTIGGYEFIPSENITVIALRAYSRNYQSITGKIGLYDSSGNTIIETGDVTIDPGWNTIYISSTDLTSGTHYCVISTFNASSSMIYSAINSLSISNKIAIVQGRYGGILGNADSANVYTSDIVIEDDSSNYYIGRQYKKVSGVWTEIKSGIIS